MKIILKSIDVDFATGKPGNERSSFDVEDAAK